MKKKKEKQKEYLLEFTKLVGFLVFFFFQSFEL